MPVKMQVEVFIGSVSAKLLEYKDKSRKISYNDFLKRYSCKP